MKFTRNNKEPSDPSASKPFWLQALGSISEHEFTNIFPTQLIRCHFWALWIVDKRLTWRTAFKGTTQSISCNCTLPHTPGRLSKHRGARYHFLWMLCHFYLLARGLCVCGDQCHTRSGRQVERNANEREEFCWILGLTRRGNTQLAWQLKSQRCKQTAKHSRSNNQFSIVILNGLKTVTLKLAFLSPHVIH